MTAGAPLRFSKMHGAGNDFVVIDLRGGATPPPPAVVQAIGDRHTGVGFDQLLTVEDAASADAVAAYRIWNADGSPSRQCGNGARCIAAWLRRDGAATGERFRLDSPAGPIDVQVLADGQYRLDMGRPEFTASRVPFIPSSDGDVHELPAPGGPLRFGVVSMGNPHAVVEVDDVAAAPVATIGPWLQARPEFPEGANVGFAQVLAPDRIRLRVFERGAGETLACGSGACAAAVVLMRRGRIGRHVAVELPGGTLRIDWPADDAPVQMTGPAAFVFEGTWP